MNLSVGGKYVVIKFDDGYHDFYMHAFPILLENGFSRDFSPELPQALSGQT